MTDHHAAVLREHGYHPLRVTRIIQETSDTRSFVFEVPEDLRDIFVYLAGQFITVRVVVDGETLMRSYSMSSAPATDAELTVTVKRVPGGKVSNWLHDHVSAGDTLEIAKPMGVFVLAGDDAPVVGFCGGSGVTPVFSIAKQALATTNRPVKLLYANRDQESVIFDEGMKALCAQYPDRLEIRHHLDSDGGFLQREAILDFLGAAREVDVFICGPTPFMDLVEATVLDAGMDTARVALERFGSPVPASAEAPAVEVSTEEVTENLTLIMRRKKTLIAYKAGDTVLDSARRAGLQPPFSCEAGNCATCMAFVQKGAARMRANTALSPEEVEEGWVLTCQAIPVGKDVTIEYEPM